MFPFYFSLSAILFLIVAFLILERVRHDYRQHQELRPFTAFLQVLMFFLHGCLLSLAYGYPLKWPSASQSAFAIAAGALIALVGLGMLLSALGVFGPLGRMLGRRVEDLKSSGIYNYTRNPQLIGYGLLLLGGLLIWPAPHAWIAYALYWVIAHRMVLGEEMHLRALYGEAYERYCAHTPRYLGWPKRQR